MTTAREKELAAQAATAAMIRGVSRAAGLLDALLDAENRVPKSFNPEARAGLTRDALGELERVLDLLLGSGGDATALLRAEEAAVVDAGGEPAGGGGEGCQKRC